jgi:hypothetical protein
MLALFEAEFLGKASFNKEVPRVPFRMNEVNFLNWLKKHG